MPNKRSKNVSVKASSAARRARRSRSRYLTDFAKAGADHLLVQAEPSATTHLHRVLSQIRDLGKKAGVVLDPASPTELTEYVLHLCDVILVMTVNPGFAGQKFLPEMLPKIRRLRQLCDARGLSPVIEVDGGQKCESAGQAIEAARSLVRLITLSRSPLSARPPTVGQKGALMTSVVRGKRVPCSKPYPVWESVCG